MTESFQIGVHRVCMNEMLLSAYFTLCGVTQAPATDMRITMEVSLSRLCTSEFSNYGSPQTLEGTSGAGAVAQDGQATTSDISTPNRVLVQVLAALLYSPAPCMPPHWPHSFLLNSV